MSAKIVSKRCKDKLLMVDVGDTIINTGSNLPTGAVNETLRSDGVLWEATNQILIEPDKVKIYSLSTDIDKPVIASVDGELKLGEFPISNGLQPGRHGQTVRNNNGTWESTYRIEVGTEGSNNIDIKTDQLTIRDYKTATALLQVGRNSTTGNQVAAILGDTAILTFNNTTGERNVILLNEVSIRCDSNQTNSTNILSLSHLDESHDLPVVADIDGKLKLGTVNSGNNYPEKLYVTTANNENQIGYIKQVSTSIPANSWLDGEMFKLYGYLYFKNAVDFQTVQTKLAYGDMSFTNSRTIGNSTNNYFLYFELLFQRVDTELWVFDLSRNNNWNMLIRPLGDSDYPNLMESIAKIEEVDFTLTQDLAIITRFNHANVNSCIRVIKARAEKWN